MDGDRQAYLRRIPDDWSFFRECAASVFEGEGSSSGARDPRPNTGRGHSRSDTTDHEENGSKRRAQKDAHEVQACHPRNHRRKRRQDRREPNSNNPVPLTRRKNHDRRNPRFRGRRPVPQGLRFHVRLSGSRPAEIPPLSFGLTGDFFCPKPWLMPGALSGMAVLCQNGKGGGGAI